MLDIAISSQALPVVSEANVRHLLDSRLYQEGRVFQRWWANPRSLMRHGALLAEAQVEHETIGIAVINFDLDYYVTDAKFDCTDRPSTKLIGIFGSYIKPEYRKRKIASTLAYLLEQQYLLSCRDNLSPQLPVVLASGIALDIGVKTFTHFAMLPISEIRYSQNYSALIHPRS